MKESVNLTLSMDEITDAILNYLKEKSIYIPEDATLKFGEDTYNAYAIVSYTKDVDIDKYEKVVKELTSDSPEEKQHVEDESQTSVDDSDDERDNAIKEILDIGSQPLSIQNAYFYLRSINYFDGKVGTDIISKDKNAIDSVIDLIKRIADPDKIGNLYHIFKDVNWLKGKGGGCLIASNTKRGEE